MVTIEQDKGTRVLKNMPDRDASVFCELVYEEAFWETVVEDEENLSKPISDILYDKNELNPLFKGVLSSKKDDDAVYSLQQYIKYYQPILEKYKLVATSSELGNKNGYYGIAVAYVEDEEVKGIYVINRGTTLTFNDISSDLEMSLAKIFPVTRVVKHTVAGVDFTKHLKSKYNDPFIAFAGHSLGGAVAELQSVYFASSMAPIGQSKCFEPYGVKSEVAPTFRVINDGTVAYLTLNPKKSLQSMACAYGYDWDCDGWQDIEDSLLSIYAGDGNIIDKKIVNYIREGDLVGTIAEPIGSKYLLPTGLTSTSVGLLHSITNYRYQGFTDIGGLIIDRVNEDNVKILKKLGGSDQLSKYDACFRLAKNFVDV